MTGKWILHMVMLGICSAEDYREKRISSWKLLLYAGLVFLYGIWEYSTQGEEHGRWILSSILGSIPGAFLLIPGKISQEAVGYGDGLAVLLIGISMGFWEALGILFTASVGACFVSLYLILRRKCGRKRQIAFLPFLFLGMAGAGLWTGALKIGKL